MKRIIFLLFLYLVSLVCSFVTDIYITFYIILLIINSLIISAYSINIALLYILLVFQITTFFSLIKMAKHFKSIKTYYIVTILSSIFTVISLTCSFGYYYLNNNLIDNTNIPYLEINIVGISYFINGIICGLYVFGSSLKNYFVYPDSFVQQTQFYLGIVIGAVIFENIFSIIKNYLKHK